MAYVHFAHDCQIGDHTIFATRPGVVEFRRSGEKRFISVNSG